MNRTGLLIALAIAAVIGIVFGLHPHLDITLEMPFFDPNRDPTGMGFWGRLDPPLNKLRDLGRTIVAFLVAPAVIAWVFKIIWPRKPMLIPGRAACLLVYTLVLGPGVFANLIMKDHWGRPRPIDVTDFGGERHFVAWWDPRGQCQENCSFVAGEPSGAFWTLAVASVAPPAWRAIAYAGAITFGTFIGLIRMAGGGHFFSDVAFAGLSEFLIIWLAYGILYRWWPEHITDRLVERILEWIRVLLHKALPWIVPPIPAIASPAIGKHPQEHDPEMPTPAVGKGHASLKMTAREGE